MQSERSDVFHGRLRSSSRGPGSAATVWQVRSSFSNETWHGSRVATRVHWIILWYVTSHFQNHPNTQHLLGLQRLGNVMELAPARWAAATDHSDAACVCGKSTSP